MPRFIVVGTYYDAIATVHRVAPTKEEAIAMWQKCHGEAVNGWLTPTCSNVDETPALELFWKGDSFEYYSDEWNRWME